MILIEILCCKISEDESNSEEDDILVARRYKNSQKSDYLDSKIPCHSTSADQSDSNLVTRKHTDFLHHTSAHWLLHSENTCLPESQPALPSTLTLT